MQTRKTTWRPVPFTQVHIAGEFWAPRLKVNRERTIAAQYRQNAETGRIDAFRLAWQPGQKPVPHIFWDSDVAKWIEAASYTLSTHPAPEIDAMVDEVVRLVVSAQQPDGYLNTYFSSVQPGKRWTNLRDCHELYCAGHMMEAAVAHYQATGKRVLLDALCRYADHIISVFGPEPGKKRGYCGHEEIELALVKLYRATGEERYLRQAQYFIEERGRQPYYFEIEARERGEQPGTNWYGHSYYDAGNFAYFQAHIPVREQTEVLGHAVRTMYLYSAVTDLAGELNDPELLAVSERVWDDLTLRKMYVTGGIGSTARNEGFTGAYDLPNQEAYAETCAAIGLVFWAHRLVQATGESRYADIMERALYNGVISGVSLDGEKFFYVNPLASDGTHHRQGWFDCACCPPNLARLLASLGQYLYSTGDDGLAVHLYAQGEARAELPDGSPLTLRVQTRYPWEGQVQLIVGLEGPADFALRLRVPGWCREYSLRLNGQGMQHSLEKGYAVARRTWQPGDSVELEFPMPVERIEAHPAVAQDLGRVALQRGPLVYCLERADHPLDVRQIALPDDATFQARFDPSLLGGVVVIESQGLAPEPSSWEGKLYRPCEASPSRNVPLRAIPYPTWDNRQPGEMAVWLPRA